MLAGRVRQPQQGYATPPGGRCHHQSGHSHQRHIDECDDWPTGKVVTCDRSPEIGFGNPPRPGADRGCRTQFRNRPHRVELESNRLKEMRRVAT